MIGISILGEDISVDRDITIDVTRDFELDSTRYTDIVSTEDVVFDFGTSFDMIVADYCDIDIGDDLNLDVAVDCYFLVGNDMIFNCYNDATFDVERSFLLWSENGQIDICAWDNSLFISAYGIGAIGILIQSDTAINVDSETTILLDSVSGVFLKGLKTGATQVGAGAAANEIWKTASHASLPDNVLMIGV